MSSISFSDVLKYWPIIAAVVLAAVGYIEMRYQVKQNDKALAVLLDQEAEDMAETLQNRSISTLITAIAKLEQKTRNISSESWEEWGYVKRTVKRMDREIPTIERRVDKLETRTHAHWGADAE